MTKLKIKYNPFAKAFKDTKVKTEEKDRREQQEVYPTVLGYGEEYTYEDYIKYFMYYLFFTCRK